MTASTVCMESSSSKTAGSPTCRCYPRKSVSLRTTWWIDTFSVFSCMVLFKSNNCVLSSICLPNWELRNRIFIDGLSLWLSHDYLVLTIHWPQFLLSVIAVGFVAVTASQQLFICRPCWKSLLCDLCLCWITPYLFLLIGFTFHNKAKWAFGVRDRPDPPSPSSE